MHIEQAIRRTTLLLVACALAGCAGGGGAGTGVASITGATPTSTGATPTSIAGPNTSPSSSDTTSSGGAFIPQNTGIIGSVGAPGPASFGATPIPAQFATPGGPAFDGSGSAFPVNVSFPVMSSSLQYSAGALSASSTDQGGTATVITTSQSSSTIQLVVPSLNLNVTWSNHVNLVGYMGDEPTYGLSYVVLGDWAQTSSGSITSYTRFLFGYETPPAAMPTSGQATFSGYADAHIFKPDSGSGIQATWATGNAAFSADFATGKISGAFTNMTYATGIGTPSISLIPWNDVSINANIAAGTNRFSGNTAATSAPQNSFSLTGSATGRIDGAFFGPSAQNLGAIWSLSDGTASAFGGVAAGH